MSPDYKVSSSWLSIHLGKSKHALWAARHDAVSASMGEGSPDRTSASKNSIDLKSDYLTNWSVCELPWHVLHDAFYVIDVCMTGFVESTSGPGMILILLTDQPRVCVLKKPRWAGWTKYFIHKSQLCTTRISQALDLLVCVQMETHQKTIFWPLSPQSWILFLNESILQIDNGGLKIK